MTDRMECVAFQSRGEKTVPVRMGSAIPSKNGNGWQVYIDVVPLNWDGRMVIQAPRERQEPRGGGRGDPHDDIPFTPEGRG